MDTCDAITAEMKEAWDLLAEHTIKTFETVGTGTWNPAIPSFDLWPFYRPLVECGYAPGLRRVRFPQLEPVLCRTATETGRSCRSETASIPQRRGQKTYTRENTKTHSESCSGSARTLAGQQTPRFAFPLKAEEARGVRRATVIIPNAFNTCDEFQRWRTLAAALRSFTCYYPGNPATRFHSEIDVMKRPGWPMNINETEALKLVFWRIKCVKGRSRDAGNTLQTSEVRSFY